MPTVELGVFAALIIAGFLPIIFINRLPYLMFLSPIIFAGLALVMFAEYDVIQTTQIPATITTASASTIERDANGTLISNITKTAQVENPAYDEVIPIINSDHNTFGWIFTAMFLILTFFGLRVLGLV